MFKIILIYCLVLAVTAGHQEDVKTNSFKLVGARTENYDQQKILKIYKITNKLLKVLRKIPDTNTIPDGWKCRTKIEDFKKHCFVPHVPYCKSNIKDCIDKARMESMMLHKMLAEAKQELEDSEKDLEKIPNCKEKYKIATPDYKKCVKEEISRGNINVSAKQEIFNNRLNNYYNTTKEFAEGLHNSVLVFLGRQYKTKTCISSSFYINDNWNLIFENDCQTSNPV